jgi:hypothetical protein
VLESFWSHPSEHLDYKKFAIEHGKERVRGRTRCDLPLLEKDKKLPRRDTELEQVGWGSLFWDQEGQVHRWPQRRKGDPGASQDTLTQALKHKKADLWELLRAPRCERALIREALNQKRRARIDLEKIYAEDPSYKDVAWRLGL